MKKQLIEVVKNMINSLESECDKKDLLLSELNFDSASSMLSSMDDILLDGGEFRCERFTDLTHEFAFNFGEMESEEFEEAKWKCIELAYDVLKKKYEKDYMENPFTNEEILIVVDENYILEGLVKIELADIIDNDLEMFLDVLDESLTGGLMLQEINYEMVKCISEENSIIFKVSGDVSDRIYELEEESFDFIDEYLDEENKYKCGYEIALDYEGVKVYHVYPDNDSKENSPYEYYFTLQPGDCEEEFDVRELPLYDKNLSIIENLKVAVDKGLL